MEKPEMKDIVRVLEGLLVNPCCTEAQLHEQIAAAFAEAGLSAKHEAKLGPHCRIDFLVGTVGVEVKKNKPETRALVKQLDRYAACPQVEELLVVAPRRVRLPQKIGRKKVTMMGLERLWGVSLP